jgi:hypothetical protein
MDSTQSKSGRLRGRQSLSRNRFLWGISSSNRGEVRKATFVRNEPDLLMTEAHWCHLSWLGLLGLTQMQLFPHWTVTSCPVSDFCPQGVFLQNRNSLIIRADQYKTFQFCAEEYYWNEHNTKVPRKVCGWHSYWSNRSLILPTSCHWSVPVTYILPSSLQWDQTELVQCQQHATSCRYDVKPDFISAL